MLKALELFGFKSFADKTRFDFPSGINVIVGPNGSGKSNVVDAMKWVLGEQSVKSLRGKEMADVIFKGGGTGRNPSNTAEVTIVFDNPDNRFPIEAPEVHVTRRVYRSGEAEYLINRQACRLRDVRDLFRGTGVGTDAYSLIEQGKVDTLLQASPRDRRAIFEEAAGISRFKAKKIEAQRRLERVEQNLLRLSDIVDEVDNRLRSVRSQATKARRYKEHTERLRQLRTHVGRVDWLRLTEKLEQIETRIQQSEERLRQLASRDEAVTARGLELETELGLLVEKERAAELRVAGAREKTASAKISIQRQRARLEELEDEASRNRRQLAAMHSRAGDLDTELHEAERSLQAAVDEHARASEQQQEFDQQARELTARISRLHEDADQRLKDHSKLLETISEKKNELATQNSLLQSASETIQRCESAASEFDAELETAARAIDSRTEREVELDLSAQRSAESLAESIENLRDRQTRVTEAQERLSELKGHHEGCRQRLEVLEQLEARQEGLTSGVQQVLERCRRDAVGPFTSVRGLVADLIQVAVDMAPLIDAALGDRSQHVVMAGRGLFEYIVQENPRFEGRVGFLMIQSSPPRGPGYGVNLSGQPGIIGRADEYVECAAEYRHLVHGLLGRTWFVEDLPSAFRCHASGARGACFVTRRGEILDSDGRLVVGPRQTSIGLISRRSQMRATRREIETLDGNIQTCRAEVTELRREIEQYEEHVQRYSAENEKASAALAEERIHLHSLKQQRARLLEQKQEVERESEAAQLAKRQAIQAVEHENAELRELQTRTEHLERCVEEDRRHAKEFELRRAENSQRQTSAKVAVARSEQRLESLQVQRDQLQRDQNERSQVILEIHSQLCQCQRRIEQAELDMLASHATVSESTLAAEHGDHDVRQLKEERRELERERAVHHEEQNTLRQQQSETEREHHASELAAGNARHERETMAERLNEDYGIDISRIEADVTDEEQQEREAIDEEIAALRRRISNIGPVNMDALSELEGLESRHGSLAQQYHDLVSAKQSLERIITRINSDSRRLFSETLEAIRGNFQVMFRKVFGGGQADIVLEEGVDILESGIDVVATPPGKRALGISLLSGGERALTAVTLLLAIFQYRPSPFCVLDEVDGPLDESNIERFVQVLNGFLDSTKFVVVTHSKKTMSSATTLYGVTMQESGVSKKVSVRFEDVSEDGHIARDAIERELGDDSQTEDGRRGVA